MGAKTNADVHLETVEETASEGTNPAEATDTGAAGLPMGEQQAGLLANSRKPSVSSLSNKQKARTGRIL